MPPIKGKYKPSYPAGYFSKEAKAERKSNREYDKFQREEEKRAKARAKAEKLMTKQVLATLKFMLKNDVIYYHHNQEESLRGEIQSQIDAIKSGQNGQVYHPYVWNYQGEGQNCMFRSQLGRLFIHSEFETINDVPLDGTYKFYTTDSGMRGSGSFDYLEVKKVEEDITVPKVNPGAFPPITSY